jgi:cell division septation protein DedD
MKALNCCVHIVCHRSLTERLVDRLLEHPEWAHGFTMTQVEGASQGEKLPSMMEQVRGRSQRVQIVAVMNLDDAHALIAMLKEKEASPHITYWITPVLEFGRFREEQV